MATPALVKHRFKGAAGLIDSDLDEENFHFTKLRVAHFVCSLWQPERPAGDERQRKRFADRFGPDAERARPGKFYRQHAVREDDFEIMIEAGGELFAADGGEIEHLGKVTCDV
jgi:hypothetical protein